MSDVDFGEESRHTTGGKGVPHDPGTAVSLCKYLEKYICLLTNNDIAA
jgi:hypothetical protein